jgi:hypothetical protein
MVASTKAPSNRAHLRILCEFARVALAHAKVWNVLVRSWVVALGLLRVRPYRGIWFSRAPTVTSSPLARLR